MYKQSNYQQNQQKTITNHQLLSINLTNNHIKISNENKSIVNGQNNINLNLDIMKQSFKDKDELLKRFMEYMRQQIQISSKFYVKKMNQQLYKQAEQISQLASLLSKNQSLLNQKDKIIQNLIKENSTKKKFIGLSKQIQQQPNFQLNKQIENKIKNIQGKIKHIQQSKEILNANQLPLLKKIQFLQKGIIKHLGAKVNLSQSKIQEHILRQKEKISIIQQQMTSLNASVNILGGQIQYNSLMNKNKDIIKEIQDLKNATNVFMSKQYKYENYKVQELKKSINMLHLKLNELDQFRLSLSASIASLYNKSISTNIYKSQRIVRQQDLVKLDVKKIQSMSTTQLTTNQSKKIIPHSANIIQYNKQQQIQYENYEDIESLSENNSNGDDEFFYPNENEQILTNEQRLTNVIKSLRLSMPVLTQVDQTGYLKSIESGMYLVDENGDGFQLEDFQLHGLVKKGILRFK